MLKRLLLIVAMGAALAACNPSTPASSVDGVESPATTESAPVDSGLESIDVSPSP